MNRSPIKSVFGLISSIKFLAIQARSALVDWQAAVLPITASLATAKTWWFQKILCLVEVFSFEKR